MRTLFPICVAILVSAGCSSSNEPAIEQYSGIVYRDINGRLTTSDERNDRNDWHSIPTGCTDNCLIEALAYPNPTDSVFILQFTTAYASVHTINVVDIYGKTISSQEVVSHASGTYSLVIDLGKYDDGFYRVKIRSREAEVGAPWYETYGDVWKYKVF